LEGLARQQKGLVASVAKKSVKKSGTSKSKPSAKKSAPKKTARPAAPAKSRPPVKAVKPVKISKPEPKPASKPAEKPVKPAKPVKTVSVKSGKTSSIAKASAKLMAKFDDPSIVLKAAKILKLKKRKKAKALQPPVDVVPVRLPPKPVTSDSKMQKNRAGLAQRELEHFRSLLLEKRRELLGDVSSMEREALRSGNTNLSNLPLHMADTGTDAYEQEFTLGLVEKDRQLLREIQIALAKIQDGSYGTCEGTGKPISKPRLEAQPWAKYSIEHARAMEKRMFRRPF
jgi:RNA polymerase-binding protein DksA